MTSTTPTEFISLRKASLQNQITEAMALNDDKQLCVLKSQWVHRYGLDTLLELEEQDSTLLVRESFSSFQSIDQMVSVENEQSEAEFLCKTSNDGISRDDKLKPIVNCQKDLLKELEIDQTSLEPLNNAQDIQGLISNEEEIENTSMDSLPVNAPAPPSPEISHLRRWLPSLEDDDLQAS